MNGFRFKLPRSGRPSPDFTTLTVHYRPQPSKVTDTRKRGKSRVIGRCMEQRKSRFIDYPDIGRWLITLGNWISKRENHQERYARCTLHFLHYGSLIAFDEFSKLISFGKKANRRNNHVRLTTTNIIRKRTMDAHFFRDECMVYYVICTQNSASSSQRDHPSSLLLTFFRIRFWRISRHAHLQAISLLRKSCC